MGIRQTVPVAGIVRRVVVPALCLVLANCSSSGKLGSRYGVSSSQRVVEYGEPVPKGGGVYRVGRPYWIAGRVYVPEENVNYREVGQASWYGDDFHGRLTANGEVFDMDGLSAAHPTLPMPCYARVTNLYNGRSLIVRVNDRGPYAADRLIDVSHRAADLLGFKGYGTARVRVEYVGPAPLEGSDDRQLAATLRTGVPAPPPSMVRVVADRPFVPQASYGRPIRDDARPPQDRPYSHGTSADYVNVNATADMSAADRTRSSGRARENPRPVTYEAHGSDRRGSAEVLAGHGLY